MTTTERDWGKLRGTSWSVAIAIAASACASEPEVGTRAMDIEEGCPEWGCGQNSPVMGPWNFHELSTAHAANAEGIMLVDFEKDGRSYEPQIINGSQLIATRRSIELAGTDLVDGYLRVRTMSGTEYRIIIAAVSPVASSKVRFWLGPQERIETYRLTYTGPDSPGETPLCNNPPDASGIGGEPWQSPFDAILFTGDRYDAQHKLVTASTFAESPGWFNIACAGSALAKLHLTRHTTAGSSHGYNTSGPERQAMLKMYVSDVCGTGHAWTRKGTPLHWTNARSWQRLDGTEFAHEALWDHTGALCLDVHRLGALYDNLDGFRGECSRPACPAVAPRDPLPLGAYLSTAVPEDPDALDP